MVDLPDRAIEGIAVYVDQVYNVTQKRRKWWHLTTEDTLTINPFWYHYIMELVSTNCSVCLLCDTPEEREHYKQLEKSLPNDFPTPALCVVPDDIVPQWCKRHRLHHLHVQSPDTAAWLDNYIITNGEPETT